MGHTIRRNFVQQEVKIVLKRTVSYNSSRVCFNTKGIPDFEKKSCSLFPPPLSTPITVFGTPSIILNMLSMSNFSGSGRNRGSDLKNDANTANNATRVFDEKLFTTCSDLVEIFTKKAISETQFATEVINATNTGLMSSTNREVENVSSSLLSNMASRRYLEGTSTVVLWYALLRVVDTCQAVFSHEQCGELRDASVEDDLSLIVSGLSSYQQHFLGMVFTAIETITTATNNSSSSSR